VAPLASIPARTSCERPPGACSQRPEEGTRDEDSPSPRALVSLAAALLGALALAAAAFGVGPFDQVNGSAGKLVSVKTIASPDNISTTGPGWVTVNSLNFNVPATVPSALVTAAFEGSSECQGSPGDWCMLRISIDGIEMDPQTGVGSVFDTQVIAQASAFRFGMAEVPVTTKYFKEASSVNFRVSSIYGVKTLAVVVLFLLARVGIYRAKFLRR